MADDAQADQEAQVLLTDIRMDGVGFSAASLTPPFCVAGLSGPVSLCYVVRGGPVWLEVDTRNREIVSLGNGSVVGLSGFVDHWFKSAPDTPVVGAKTLAVHPLSEPSDARASFELLVGHAPMEALALTNTLSGVLIIPPDGGRVARRIARAIAGIEDELRDKPVARRSCGRPQALRNYLDEHCQMGRDPNDPGPNICTQRPHRPARDAGASGGGEVAPGRLDRQPNGRHRRHVADGFRRAFPRCDRRHASAHAVPPETSFGGRSSHGRQGERGRGRRDGRLRLGGSVCARLSPDLRHNAGAVARHPQQQSATRPGLTPPGRSINECERSGNSPARPAWYPLAS